MGKPRKKDLPDLAHLAVPDAQIAVRVTPRAARNGLTLEGESLRATVTAVPENGKANAAVRALLATAMGVAPTHLQLIRGETARDKVFVYSDGSVRS